MSGGISILSFSELLNHLSAVTVGAVLFSRSDLVLVTSDGQVGRKTIKLLPFYISQKNRFKLVERNFNRPQFFKKLSV